jgi:hypothetical protein
MPRIKPTDEQLRNQIEAAAAENYSTKQIDDMIADSLLADGQFQGRLNARELALIMRNVVHTVFDQHKIGGRNVSLIHNVPSMKVAINESQAQICFVVHLHRPIVAFLQFRYDLINDPVSITPTVRFKAGSLSITEHTRRFDLKAKAALAAINIEELARKELANPTSVICSTLPSQLRQRGATGVITCVDLTLADQHLEISLKGVFKSLKT